MTEAPQTESTVDPEATISRLKESHRLLQLVLRNRTEQSPAPELEQ